MAVDFRSKQAEFAAYIRDPANNPAPSDVEPRRMAMYRELFFNNIDSFLSSNFPVLRKILNDEQWLELAGDFFAEHRCQTPHFSEIAEEFLAYLQNRKNADDYPFLLELAHYEWVELALAIARAEPRLGDTAFAADILGREIALSPLAWPLAYQYPVQRIAPDFLPLMPPEQATYLIVYRDRDDNVHFMQSTAITFRLLQILEQHQSLGGAASLERLATEARHIDPERLFEQGVKTLQDMAEKGIVIPADGA
ncbi:MAG: putative DNA-binding domain-containing protein [Methylococcaceae bacterium]|nr:putative DNA-binding domain-containing protein [Methylococcaceae bacterium]